MKKYRALTEVESIRLESQNCKADNWKNVQVAIDFKTDFIHHVRFSGNVCLGVFSEEFLLAGGITKHSGLSYVTLHNRRTYPYSECRYAFGRRKDGFRKRNGSVRPE